MWPVQKPQEHHDQNNRHGPQKQSEIQNLFLMGCGFSLSLIPVSRHAGKRKVSA